MKIIKLAILSLLIERSQSYPCGYVKVRQVPNGHTKFYKAVDRLVGTEVYGDPTDNSVEWSIKFDHMSFNRVFLTNEFFTKWIYADREEIIPAAGYNGVKRTWMRSSASPMASALSVGIQYCRNGH